MILRCIVTDCTNPYINLATEEYLAFNSKEQEIILFLWQNAHTVVIGRNQNPWKECLVEQIKEDGCRLARRMSGGGAVFHDLGNLNFTFIAKKSLYDVTKQTNVILRALLSQGVKAEKNGRNDLTIDNMKFSGHAYYNSLGFCCHHGTLMLDVKKDDMVKYLNVSESKLKSKGVSSVRSRVTNIKEYLPDVTTNKMIDALIKAASDEYGVVPNIERIHDYANSKKVDSAVSQKAESDKSHYSDPSFLILKDKYSSPEWIYGNKIPFEQRAEDRLPWGSIDIHLEMKGGTITGVQLFSDSLETEIFQRLESLIEGTAYDKKAIASLNYSEIAQDDIEKEISKDVLNLIVKSF